jgi:hypothetical protein
MLLMIIASVPAVRKKTTDEMMNIKVRLDKFFEILYNGEGPCSWSYSSKTVELLSIMDISYPKH